MTSLYKNLLLSKAQALEGNFLVVVARFVVSLVVEFALLSDYCCLGDLSQDVITYCLGDLSQALIIYCVLCLICICVVLTNLQEGMCDTFHWVILKWPPTLQKALIRLWGMYEEEKYTRISGNVEYATPNY